MIAHQSELENKHLPIVAFFKENGFGTSMPILNRFSFLKPIDRCIILEKLFIDGVRNIYLLDKLVLAYVKIDRQDLATKVIEYAKQNGGSKLDCNGMEFKLGIGIPPKKLDSERLDKVDSALIDTNNILEIDFLSLLKIFINEPNNPATEDESLYIFSDEKIAILKILKDIMAIDDHIDENKSNYLEFIIKNLEFTNYEINASSSIEISVVLEVVKKMTQTKKKFLVDLIINIIAIDDVIDQKKMNLFQLIGREANLPLTSQK